jgi:hypothetical protein
VGKTRRGWPVAPERNPDGRDPWDTIYERIDDAQQNTREIHRAKLATREKLSLKKFRDMRIFEKDGNE